MDAFLLVIFKRNQMSGIFLQVRESGCVESGVSTGVMEPTLLVGSLCITVWNGLEPLKATVVHALQMYYHQQLWDAIIHPTPHMSLESQQMVQSTAQPDSFFFYYKAILCFNPKLLKITQMFHLP